ncbi:hypothetical protein FRC09_012620 [Ceratobasidium sp. 395]|nr:hypothetical protein FRC09_012620 [Ceratobasidium sp. 395]
MPLPLMPALPNPKVAHMCNLCHDHPNAIWTSDSRKSDHKAKYHSELCLGLKGRPILIQQLFHEDYDGFNSPPVQVLDRPHKPYNYKGKRREAKEKVLRDILDQLPSHAPEVTMPTSTGFADTAPFLRTTEWAEMVEGYLRNELVQAALYPSDTDPLHCLIQPCRNVFARQQIRIQKAYPTIRQLWMEGSTSQSRLNPLGLSGTDAYTRQMIRLLAFVLRVANGLVITKPGDHLPLFLTPEQQLCAEDLWDKIKQKSPIDKNIQELLVECFAPPNTDHMLENKFNDIVHMYCLLSAIDRDGQFMEPKNLTTPLAGIQYIMRSVMLQESFDCLKRGNTPSDPNLVFESVKARYLSTNRVSPFGGLQALKTTVWSYAWMSTSLPNAQWVDEEAKKAIINGKPILISEMKDMVRSMLAEIKQLLFDDLLFGISPDTLGWKWRPGDSLVDDLSNSSEGYSLFSEEENLHYFAGQDKALMEAFVMHPKASKYFFEGRYSWTAERPQMSPLKQRAWLKKWDRFIELLALIMHILGGQPARSTELLALLTENTANRIRHLYWFDNHFFFLVCASKLTSITSKDRIIVHGLPEELNEILLLANALVRPAAAALVHQLSSSKDQYWSQKIDFFSCSGSLLTSKRFAQLLQLWTEESLGVPLGIGDWRHLTILMMRRYFRITAPPTTDDEDPFGDCLFDLQAGHRSKTARRHYAIEPLEWSLMRDDTIQRFIAISRLVSNWYLEDVSTPSGVAGQKRKRKNGRAGPEGSGGSSAPSDSSDLETEGAYKNKHIDRTSRLSTLPKRITRSHSLVSS